MKKNKKTLPVYAEMANDKLVRCIALSFTKPDGTSIFKQIKKMFTEKNIKVKAKHQVAPWRHREVFKKKIAVHYREIGKLAARFGEEVYLNTEKYVMGQKGDSVIYFILEWYAPKDLVQDSYDWIRTYIVGKTNPDNADPESIRGKFGLKHQKDGQLKNLIHMSDSYENAIEEIKNFYSDKPDELSQILYGE